MKFKFRSFFSRKQRIERFFFKLKQLKKLFPLKSPQFAPAVSKYHIRIFLELKSCESGLFSQKSALKAAIS